MPFEFNAPNRNESISVSVQLMLEFFSVCCSLSLSLSLTLSAAPPSLYVVKASGDVMLMLITTSRMRKVTAVSLIGHRSHFKASVKTIHN